MSEEKAKAEVELVAVEYLGPYTVKLNVSCMNRARGSKLSWKPLKDKWVAASLFVYPEAKHFLVHEDTKGKSHKLRLPPTREMIESLRTTFTLRQVKGHGEVMLIQGLIDGNEKGVEERSLMVEFETTEAKREVIAHIKSWEIEGLDDQELGTEKLPVAQKLL